MGRKKRVIAVIKIPSFAEVIAKVRGVSPPAGKIHRPKKGGSYIRAAEKRRLKKENVV